jgi:DNA-binding MurR/RpiR family transcriptional regulator
MAPLIRIRSGRDQMSAIERRIADYLLENAHLLRDYSSQQLADALGISQSSVVKFSQKLGFKGYPDLKYSVADALARDGAIEDARPLQARAERPHAQRAEALWRSKAAAEEETRSLNPTETLEGIADALHLAGRVVLGGHGEDGLRAQGFAFKLSQLGILALPQCDPVLLASTVAATAPGDVLMLFCEHGKRTDLAQLGRRFRTAQGKLVSVTRHSANPLRAHADAAVLVSAHDERPQVEPLLYQSALQQLLDLLLVLVCERWPQRLERLHAGIAAEHPEVDE